MAARTFKKKQQQQSGVFFGVIFYVYTNVDIRERARASYWKLKIGGGGYFRNFWVGMCCWEPGTFNLYQS